MTQRGRRSAASLSVVTSLPSGRPPPPDRLSEPEQAEWRAIVGALSAHWFPRETHPALAALCRHTCRSRLLADQLTAAQVDPIKTVDGLAVLDKLCAMLERETRAIMALSRALRLTNQTRMDKGAAARSSGGPVSYYDTMELEHDG